MKLVDYECDGGCGSVQQFPSAEDTKDASVSKLVKIFTACSDCYNLCDYDPEDIPKGANVHWGWLEVGSPAHKAFKERGVHPMSGIIDAIKKYIAN